MIVSELIYELENMPQDAEVSLAMQPNYPMEHQIDGVVEVNEGKVVISEREGNSYLDEEAVEACGWER